MSLSPVMECTVSKATILGTLGNTLERSSSRCLGSLCLKMCLGTPELQMPWIMLARLPESLKISQPRRCYDFQLFVFND